MKTKKIVVELIVETDVNSEILEGRIESVLRGHVQTRHTTIKKIESRTYNV